MWLVVSVLDSKGTASLQKILPGNADLCALLHMGKKKNNNYHLLSKIENTLSVSVFFVVEYPPV